VPQSGKLRSAAARVCLLVFFPLVSPDILLAQGLMSPKPLAGSGARLQKPVKPAANAASKPEAMPKPVWAANRPAAAAPAKPKVRKKRKVRHKARRSRSTARHGGGWAVRTDKNPGP